MDQKAFTVRLPIEQACELEQVAQVDGSSIAEEIRKAISLRIAQRRGDPDFQQRLLQVIQANQEILQRLRTT